MPIARHLSLITLDGVKDLIARKVKFTCRYELVEVTGDGKPRYQCIYSAGGEELVLVVAKVQKHGPEVRKFAIWPGLVNHHNAYGDGAPVSIDLDCAIMLCMAGGFPPNVVCANAFRVMIRRILPWPSRPPFGICTYAAVPVVLGGPGGDEDLDTTSSDYNWLRKTRVIWWEGRSWENEDGYRLYDWELRSCNGENRSCRTISRQFSSYTSWPRSFVTENGQVISVLGGGRAMMMEYGDYDGVMDHSVWYRY